MNESHPLPTIKIDLNHSDPWTESEFHALDETTSRVELIDGVLLVGPQGQLPHQYISARLMNVLAHDAHAANLRVVPAGMAHLGPGRLVTPDITVADVDRSAIQSEASEIVMTVEITSPHTATIDRGLKKTIYAEASIGWYLLVEPDHETYESISLRLFRFDGTTYVEHGFAANGETLIMEVPLPVEISTAYLLDF